MQAALAAARALGAKVHFGEREPAIGAGGCYVRPAIVEMKAQAGPDAATRPSRRSST